MTGWEAPLIISGSGIVLSWVIFARLLWILSNRINTLNERIAYIEGKSNGKHKKEELCHHQE